MRIKINVQIIMCIILFSITKQIEIYSYLMVFALIHEIAHMIAGMILKLKPIAIEIQPFGVAVQFENDENTELNKIIIAIAGPLINIIMAVIFAIIGAKEIIINTNIILGIFNLMPIYPLDGGRILKAIIRISKNQEMTDKIINKVSNILMIFLSIVSSILILIFKNIGLFIIILYLWMIVTKENNRYELKKRINKILEK